MRAHLQGSNCVCAQRSMTTSGRWWTARQVLARSAWSEIDHEFLLLVPTHVGSIGLHITQDMCARAVSTDEHILVVLWVKVQYNCVLLLCSA